MGFIESYKRLEKLCGEIFDSERRVSAYIDEMVNTPNGASIVKGWNEDLKQLKHYRWVRNRIVHEPDCTEKNMCKPEDIQWIDNFYSRIINQTDPLALYAKAISSRSARRVAKGHKASSYKYSGSSAKGRNSSQKQTGCLTLFVSVFLCIVAAGLIFLILQH